MKKILLFVAVVIAITVSLPLIGNKVVNDTINDRVEVLNSYGIETVKHISNNRYFSTTQHFEFILKESDRFIEYLNSFAQTQIPPYVNAALQGVKIGIDLKYYNFPLSDAIGVDIYPLSLSTKTMQNLHRKDLRFYNYLKDFLETKGFLYHINYHVVNSDFDGYLKNVKESYDIDGNAKIFLQLQGARFKGNGELIAPKFLETTLENLILDITDGQNNLHMTLNDLKGSSNFDSVATYVSSMLVDKMEFNLKNKSDNIFLNLSKFHLNTSSAEEKKRLDFYVKSSLKELHLKGTKGEVSANDINYDLDLNGVSQEDYNRLRKLLAQEKVSKNSASEDAIQQAILQLFAKGFSLNIADLSMKSLSFDNKKQLKGFRLDANISVDKDEKLVEKFRSNMQSADKNLHFTSKVLISKELFDSLNQDMPVTGFAKSFAKEQNDDVVFDMIFKDAKLYINDKAVQ